MRFLLSLLRVGWPPGNRPERQRAPASQVVPFDSTISGTTCTVAVATCSQNAQAEETQMNSDRGLRLPEQRHQQRRNFSPEMGRWAALSTAIRCRWSPATAPTRCDATDSVLELPSPRYQLPHPTTTRRCTNPGQRPIGVRAPHTRGWSVRTYPICAVYCGACMLPLAFHIMHR